MWSSLPFARSDAELTRQVSQGRDRNFHRRSRQTRETQRWRCRPDIVSKGKEEKRERVSFLFNPHSASRSISLPVLFSSLSSSFCRFCSSQSHFKSLDASLEWRKKTSSPSGNPQFLSSTQPEPRRQLLPSSRRGRPSSLDPGRFHHQRGRSSRRHLRAYREMRQERKVFD